MSATHSRVVSKPGARRRVFQVAPDIQLVGDELGPEGGDAVIFLHGGGQTRGAWGAAQQVLADRSVRSLALDQRGHGESSRGPDYLLTSYVVDLAKVVAEVGGRPALVGASLGGLASMLLLGEAAPPASALVLVDITPRHAPPGAEKIRGFMLAYPEGFDTLDAAADAIAEYLPNRKRPSSLGGLQKNLAQGADGRWRWRWDPKFLTGGPGEAFSYDEGRAKRALAVVKVPPLPIKGGASEIVTDEAVAETRLLLPSIRVERLAGAAHMVAGDDNDVFLATILSFLDPLLRAAPPRP